MINKITLEFAEIIGLLCAEGSHIISYSTYTENRYNKQYVRNNKKSERIEFYNKDKNLSHHYLNLLFKEFGLRFRITKDDKVNIGNRAVIKRIITETPLGHLNWQVPESVANSNLITKLYFLRGFFDGDGTAVGTVRFFSTNYGGIHQISGLLKELNYKHTIQGPVSKPKRKPYYIIQISRKDQFRFLEDIQPISKYV